MSAVRRFRDWSLRSKLIVPVVAAETAGGALLGWALVDDERLLAGWAAAGTLVLSLLLTVWLARSVTRPLTSVRRAAEEFRGGNFGHRARVHANDEIGQLARTFNLMGERLARTTVDRDYVDNVLMSMRDALFVVDRDGTIRTANNAALSWLGYKEEELLGKPIHKVLPETEAPAETDNMAVRGRRRRAHIISKRVLDLIPQQSVRDTFLRGKDGAMLPVSISGAVMRDDRGSISGIVCVAQDRGERMRIQEELERRNTLLLDAIKHANIMAAEARQANLAKSQFVANMSHELRTPLNAVTGMTQLLMLEELTPQQREYAETVRDSADALLTLVDDILDFAKIEAGKLTIEPAPFNLRTTIEQVIELHMVMARRKKLELMLAYAPDAPQQLIGDAGRIRQVISNFVSNAVKFTDHGLITIRVARQGGGDRDATLRIAVEDRGIGIAEDKLDAVFDKFTQADASTTRVYGGTGLGLAICKQIAALMNGRVGVDSKLGEGSTFWLEVALPIDPSAVTARPAAAAPLPAVRPVAASRHHILVAEDNPVNQRVTVRMLEVLGCRVDVADTGARAVAMWDAGLWSGDPYDLVFMDVHMPEMDGFEATAEIRRREAGGFRTRIVALTANAMRGDRDRCITAGMDDYIAKPVKLDDLRATLADRGEAEAGSDAAPAPPAEEEPPAAGDQGAARTA